MKCHEKVAASVEQFMMEAKLNEAYLFGGSVLDTLLDKNAKISDYDICVRNEENFYQTLQNLKARNVPVSDVMRTHNVYAVISHPSLGQIDLSCMNPEDNGIFNIEKVYARFQRRDDGFVNIVVDKYGAVDSMTTGKGIRLASTPEKEGAYNILRRFLALSGKYNLDLSVNGKNQEAINQMKDAFAAGYPFIPQDRVRCLSRLVASLKRVSDRQGFVKALGEQNILKDAFPEIHKLFTSKSFPKAEELKTCSTQKELLELMVKYTRPQDRDNLMDCLMILSKREKARQDKGVAEYIEEIGNKKTSVQGLLNLLINPLYVHKLQKEGCK